jgi:transcription elongation factor GreB
MIPVFELFNGFETAVAQEQARKLRVAAWRGGAAGLPMLKFLSHARKIVLGSPSGNAGLRSGRLSWYETCPMSKAFVKENDDDQDDAPEVEAPAIPAGAKNYITPKGEARLRGELHQLLTVDRPKMTEVVSWAASLGDRSENADYIYGKKRLREIDRRIRFLTKRLEIAEVVDPANTQADTVRFGATVRVNVDGEGEKTYVIVGIDETDGKRGRVSWISPLGKALLRAKAGDVVTFRAPRGDVDLEILEIRYVALED